MFQLLEEGIHSLTERANGLNKLPKGTLETLKALLTNTSSDRMSTSIAYLENNRDAMDTGKSL